MSNVWQKELNSIAIVLIMAQKKILATEFENYIKDFLTKLNFSDVDGGRDTFRINNVQIDYIGKTLLNLL